MSCIKVENIHLIREKAKGGTSETEESIWIQNGRLINPQEHFYSSVSNAQFEPTHIVDGRGGYVVPGFIDVQINGAFGIDFSCDDITKEDILYVATNLLQHGVTSFCPTLVSSPSSVYAKLLPLFQSIIEQDRRVSPQTRASLLGLHLEGPFIAKECKGAHNPAYLRTPTDGLKSLLDCYTSLHCVSLVTIAPELPGAMETISELTKEGIIVSLGHSQATYEVGDSALQRGARVVTHLFNAMVPFHHRDPGLLGLLASPNPPYYGIILDGIHSHYSATKIALSTHSKGIVLITDAIAGMGLNTGTYNLAGTDVTVNSDGKATLKGTDILAGSVLTMDQAVRALHKYASCSLRTIIKGATKNPAKALRLYPENGSLNYHTVADFVVLDKELKVRQTWINGHLAYNRTENDGTGEVPSKRHFHPSLGNLSVQTN